MRYIALLRGINITGNTMIKMADLKRSFESLGFRNVVSYINSGNLAFDCRRMSEVTLVNRLEGVIDRDFDLRVQVIVREQESIPRIVAANPYAGEFESHKEMHVLFLKKSIPSARVAELRAAAPAAERFTIKGREIYCHLPMGVADSLMGRGLVERRLKIAVTARNWRTVEKLAEL